MIFSGLELLGEVPFRDVIIHATVLARDGRRMSKSLGTGIDPREVIEAHGADATPLRADEDVFDPGRALLGRVRSRRGASSRTSSGTSRG